MIANTARAWPPISPGLADCPSGPASVVPATAQCRRPPQRGCSRQLPPTAPDEMIRRPRRRSRARRPRRWSRCPPIRPPPGPGRPRASAPRAGWSAGRWNPARGIRSGRGRCPPIGPEAVERRHAQPRGRVRVGGAARRRIAHLEPERSREHLRVIDEPTDRAKRSIGQWRFISATVMVTSGSAGCAASARMSASAASRSWRVGPRRSTWSTARSATTLGRMPPSMTPTLTVTPASGR